MKIEEIKIGEAFATRNITGYEGKEVGIFLGFDEALGGKRLLYIQWINSFCEKIFREDFEETFYPITLEGVDEDGQVKFKKKKIKK